MMNKMRLLGYSASARSRAPRAACTARLASIRAATALGGVLAFALLCMVSVRANAAPLPGAAAPEGQTWPLALAGLAIVVLVGGWLARPVLKRAAQKLKGVEGKRKSRCRAVETREQTAGNAASRQVNAGVTRERLRLVDAMHHYSGGPLTVIAGLLESVETTALPPTQRAKLRVIQSALRTWAQTLHDLLDASQLASRTLVLDESVTDLRELIEGVLTLLAPAAAQQGLRLSANIDRTVAMYILADSGRLGQIVFHLVSRAVRLTRYEQIVVSVSTEPLNVASQRIFIFVTDVDAATVDAADLKPCGPGTVEPFADVTHFGRDADLALCQLLAQRMHGELSVGRVADSYIHALFSASFTVERWETYEEPAREAEMPQPVFVTQPVEASESALLEPFERSYLNALSEEGIDLHAFLHGWRRSMDDDLARLYTGHDQRDIDGLRALLHRLSGAVGLVGARSLMEALQGANASQLVHDAGSIDVLVRRAKTLMMQLDITIDPHRSLVR